MSMKPKPHDDLFEDSSDDGWFGGSKPLIPDNIHEPSSAPGSKPAIPQSQKTPDSVAMHVNKLKNLNFSSSEDNDDDNTSNYHTPPSQNRARSSDNMHLPVPFASLHNGNNSDAPLRGYSASSSASNSNIVAHIHHRNSTPSPPPPGAPPRINIPSASPGARDDSNSINISPRRISQSSGPHYLPPSDSRPDLFGDTLPPDMNGELGHQLSPMLERVPHYPSQEPYGIRLSQAEALAAEEEEEKAARKAQAAKAKEKERQAEEANKAREEVSLMMAPPKPNYPQPNSTYRPKFNPKLKSKAKAKIKPHPSPKPPMPLIGPDSVPPPVLIAASAQSPISAAHIVESTVPGLTPMGPASGQSGMGGAILDATNLASLSAVDGHRRGDSLVSIPISVATGREDQPLIMGSHGQSGASIGNIGNELIVASSKEQFMYRWWFFVPFWVFSLVQLVCAIIKTPPNHVYNRGECAIFEIRPNCPGYGAFITQITFYSILMSALLSASLFTIWFQRTSSKPMILRGESYRFGNGLLFPILIWCLLIGVESGIAAIQPTSRHYVIQVMIDALGYPILFATISFPNAVYREVRRMWGTNQSHHSFAVIRMFGLSLRKPYILLLHIDAVILLVAGIVWHIFASFYVDFDAINDNNRNRLIFAQIVLQLLLIAQWLRLVYNDFYFNGRISDTVSITTKPIHTYPRSYHSRADSAVKANVNNAIADGSSVVESSGHKKETTLSPISDDRELITPSPLSNRSQPSTQQTQTVDQHKPVLGSHTSSSLARKQFHNNPMIIVGGRFVDNLVLLSMIILGPMIGMVWDCVKLFQYEPDRHCSSYNLQFSYAKCVNWWVWWVEASFYAALFITLLYWLLIRHNYCRILQWRKLRSAATVLTIVLTLDFLYAFFVNSCFFLQLIIDGFGYCMLFMVILYLLEFRNYWCANIDVIKKGFDPFFTYRSGATNFLTIATLYFAVWLAIVTVHFRRDLKFISRAGDNIIASDSIAQHFAFLRCVGVFTLLFEWLYIVLSNVEN